MQKLPFKVVRNFRQQYLQKKKYKNRGRHYKSLKSHKNKKKPLICKKNIPVRISPTDHHFMSEGARSTYKVIDTVG